MFAPVVRAAATPFKSIVDANVQAPPNIMDSLAPKATAGLYVRLDSVIDLPL